MIYDFIIVGGGIAGLYSAYLLSKKYPRSTILVLEKESYLGGRVFTHSDKHMQVEAGAGRFSKNNKLLIELIRELGLYEHIVPIPKNIGYAFSDEQHNFIDNNTESASYIKKVIEKSKGEPIEKLRNISFVDFASTVLKLEEIEYVKNSFGYYSELVIMNAHDAIHLISGITTGNSFFGLKGGLSQIIRRLTDVIEKHTGSKIIMKKTVENMHVLGCGPIKGVRSIIQVFCKENNRPYLGFSCICALPKQVAEKIPFFKPWKSRLQEIVCAPLCRIYSKYLPDSNGTFWFSKLTKFTTNNYLRMVIHTSNEGVVMVSYTDNKFANKWHRLFEKKGNDGIDKEIHKLMKKSTGIDIPDPLATNVFYWGCGVGYWRVGANSDRLFTDIMQPDKAFSIYLCGEHYSEKNQQWMEGALETAQKVIKKL
jgi:monoamine oxidase